ncbi:hypothetical protein [Kaarinaea lacus]
MENIIEFKALGDNWYEGELKIGDQKTSINGSCEKNPITHLQSAYQFFIQGGVRAQCVFNHNSSCYLIILRRQNNIIKVDVAKLDERFENNAKLKNHQYLDAHIVFSASTPLASFASAVFSNGSDANSLH